jgi:hypothetical protein
MDSKLQVILSRNVRYFGAAIAAVAIATASATLIVGVPIAWRGAQAPSALSPSPEIAATPAPAPAAAATANGPAAAPDPSPSAPTAQRPAFDIVRVEPTGDAVIAGHAAPKATIELRDDGRVVAQTSADASGDFTILPPSFSAGEHRLDLAAQTGEAAPVVSESVVIDVQALTVNASNSTESAKEPIAIPSAAASTDGSALAKPAVGSAGAGVPGSVHPTDAARGLMRTFRAAATGRREGLSAAARSPETTPEPMPEGDARPVLHVGGHR